MSKFIEGSKHQAMTAAVTKHFAGGNAGQKSGTDPTLRMPPYGDQSWNPAPGSESMGGMVNSAPSASGGSMFSTPGQKMPKETGVGYKPLDRAGHTNTADPFAALANGLESDYGSGAS